MERAEEEHSQETGGWREGSGNHEINQKCVRKINGGFNKEALAISTAPAPSMVVTEACVKRELPSVWVPLQ